MRRAQLKARYSYPTRHLVSHDHPRPLALGGKRYDRPSYAKYIPLLEVGNIQLSPTFLVDTMESHPSNLPSVWRCY